jgi:hypothetical protein
VHVVNPLIPVHLDPITPAPVKVDPTFEIKAAHQLPPDIEIHTNVSGNKVITNPVDHLKTIDVQDKINPAHETHPIFN